MPGAVWASRESLARSPIGSRAPYHRRRFLLPVPHAMHQLNVSRALNLLGLFLGFVGTVIVWRNSAPAGGQASYWTDGQMSQDIAKRGGDARNGLRLGLGFLAAGFALQFVAAAI